MGKLIGKSDAQIGLMINDAKTPFRTIRNKQNENLSPFSFAPPPASRDSAELGLLLSWLHAGSRNGPRVRLIEFRFSSSFVSVVSANCFARTFLVEFSFHRHDLTCSN
jgi:hypothetical protein